MVMERGFAGALLGRRHNRREPEDGIDVKGTRVLAFKVLYLEFTLGVYRQTAGLASFSRFT